MKPVIVKNVAIGAGTPKVCVPIVETDAAEILTAVEKAAVSAADLIEWRADHFVNHNDEAELLRVLQGVYQICAGKPLLFTLRSVKEGGKSEVSDEAYLSLVQAVIRSGNVDLVDVEMQKGEEICRQLLKNAHLHSLPVVMSRHHFTTTPDDDLLVAEVRTMKELGADILKLAVMPLDKEDVVRLLLITEQLSRDYSDVPVVTVSMSGMGLISRISGEISGSAITFASLEKASAPGQISLAEMKELLDKVHNGIVAEED